MWDDDGAGVFIWEGVSQGVEDVHLTDTVVIMEDTVYINGINTKCQV